jgi:hypothetical protein
VAVEIYDLVTSFLVEFAPEVVISKMRNNLSEARISRGSLVDLCSLFLIFI